MRFTACKIQNVTFWFEHDEWSDEDRREWRRCCRNGGPEGFKMHRDSRDRFWVLPEGAGFEAAGFQIVQHCLLYGQYKTAKEIAFKYIHHMRKRYGQDSHDELNRKVAYRLFRAERNLDIAERHDWAYGHDGEALPPSLVNQATQAERLLEARRNDIIHEPFSGKGKALHQHKDFDLLKCKLACDRVRAHWKWWLASGRVQTGSWVTEWESTVNRLADAHKKLRQRCDEDPNLAKPMIMETLAKAAVIDARPGDAIHAYLEIKDRECREQCITPSSDREMYRYEHLAWRETWVVACIKDRRIEEGTFSLECALAAAEKYEMRHNEFNLKCIRKLLRAT